MEAADTFEAKGRAYKTTRPRILEARNADSYRYVNLKPQGIQ